MSKILLFLKTIMNMPLRLFTKISPLALMKNCKIEKSSSISSGCRVYDCNIDKYTYIGKNTTVCNTEIGKFCSIAYECIINPGDHPLDMISTSPVFYNKKNILKKSFNNVKYNEYEKVLIGNDVWIGTRAFIGKGVKIGDGAIIGAYAVVTKDVEPYAIVVGNPGKVIKKRFDDNIIKQLEKDKWWSWSEEKIKLNAKYFSDIVDFLEKTK